MAKLIVVLGLLLIVACSASKLPSNVNIKVVSRTQIKEILKQYPNAVELSKVVKPQPPVIENGAKPASAAASTRSYMIEYFMGNRVVGDFLIGHDQQALSWTTPQDIEMTLTYPTSGTNGYIISYVSIIVTQSYPGGKAYAVWGGIGQRYIRIIVEAYQTYIFQHNTNFYGY